MSSSSFRFLDGPSELRNNVYEEHFTPVTISLRTTAQHVPRSVVSPQDTSIFKVCHQLYAETIGYYHDYRDNEFIINVNLDPSALRIIPEQHLSDTDMGIIKRLVLVLDIVGIIPLAKDTVLIGSIHFPPFQKLDAVTDLNICAIAPADERVNRKASWTVEKVMDQILQYLPTSCTITYGASNPETTNHIADLILKHRLASGIAPTSFSFWLPDVMKMGELNAAGGRAAANGAIVKGSKNLAHLTAEKKKRGEVDQKSIIKKAVLRENEADDKSDIQLK